MAKAKGHRAESDVEAETHEARSRAGKDGSDASDGTYVGATSPDDPLDVGETGAEARTRHSS